MDAANVPNIDYVHADASIANQDPFKFSHGLTGVDQRSNYLLVHILATTALIPVLFTMVHRLYIASRNEKTRAAVTASSSAQEHDRWSIDRSESWAMVKRHFLYPRLWTNHHDRESAFSQHSNLGTIPRRPQALVVGIYTISNIAYCIAIPGQKRHQKIAAFRGRCVTLEALSGEATRVTFSLKRLWNANPGSHVHVYLPKVALWSSHPFSIAWSQSSGYSQLNPEKLPSTVQDTKSKDGRGTVSCVIRARTGMTHSLYGLASKAGGNTVSLWGAIEGPYGGPHTLESYGIVVLFAGGVGITHQLSFVRHLLAAHTSNSAATHKILLVWCILNIKLLDWIELWLEELSTMSSFREVFRIRPYVSRVISVNPGARWIPRYTDVRRPMAPVRSARSAGPRNFGTGGCYGRFGLWVK